MTSKKHWTLRAAGLLFALVLITSCFVGGTFAKYVKSVSGTQMARVARFGVEITATNDTAFKTTYDTDAAGLSSVISSMGASGTRDKVVAPGTGENDTVTLSITGKPEVAVHVELAMKEEEIMDVFLKNGTYPDLTTANPDDEFNLAKPYHPIVFTLKKNGNVEKTGTISEISAYLATFSEDYTAGTDLSAEFGTYTLSWKWAFEDATIENKDQADTLLGALAAKQSAFSYLPGTDYQTGICFKLTATVTQID